MSKKKSHINLLACLLIVVLLCAGCAATKDTTSPGPSTSEQDEQIKRRHKPLDPKTTFVHIVQYPGESLSIIAAWYTGDLQNWKQLARENPGFDPARIFIGNRIRIPKRMMKTYQPMPQEFVNKYIGKQAPTKKAGPAGAPETSPSTPKGEEEEVPLLFGPK